MRRNQRITKQPYLSDFINEIDRKVLFREPLLLEKLTYSAITGSSEKNDPDHSDIIQVLEKILVSRELKIRLLNTIYNQSKNSGIACLMIRKLLTSDKLTMLDLHNYYMSQCSRYNVDSKSNQSCTSICFRSDQNLIRDLENLLPSEADPKTILCLGCSADTIKLLQNKYKKATIDVEHKNNKFDLIVSSCYLHHQSPDNLAITAKKLSSVLNTNGYIFVREIDTENDNDILLANKMHDFNNVLCGMDDADYEGTNIKYVTRDDLNKLFDELTMYSESQYKYDPMFNPTKLYGVLFVKNTQ
jgi:hypothetical protein